MRVIFDTCFKPFPDTQVTKNFGNFWQNFCAADCSWKLYHMLVSQATWSYATYWFPLDDSPQPPCNCRLFSRFILWLCRWNYICSYWSMSIFNKHGRNFYCLLMKIHATRRLKTVVTHLNSLHGSCIVFIRRKRFALISILKCNWENYIN